MSIGAGSYAAYTMRLRPHAGASSEPARRRSGACVCAAQTGMIGPMSTILMGVLLLGEPFTAWVAAGTALVIAGIYVFTRSPR